MHERITAGVRIGLVAAAAWIAVGCTDLGNDGTRDAGRATASRSTQRGEPIDVSAIGHDQGLPDAPVLVIEFSDFGCPYCAQFALETYPVLHREFVMTGKVRWKYVPFVMGTFPNGSEATRAAECAAEQGEHRFWTMHDLLFEHQREWKSTSSPEALFRGLASDMGLDQDRFASCFDENRPGDRIHTNNLVASTLGVHATPTFLVNGMLVRGALPVEQFRMLLSDALSP